MFKVDSTVTLVFKKTALWCKCPGKYSGIQIGEQRFRIAPSSVWTMLTQHFPLSAAQRWEAGEEFVELE